MTILKTFVSIFVLLLLVSPLQLLAQSVQPDTARAASRPVEEPQRVRGVQYASREEAAAAMEANNQLPLLAGVSVMVDVAGAAMAAATPYGQYEAAARVNLRGRYFPIVEVGWGVSDNLNETTDNHFKTSAPYFRAGVDYNVAKNKRSGNRIFIGVRYGFSSFKYDMEGPDVEDEVYGTSTPFHLEGLKGNTHWGEALFGLEARVWGMFHLGWTIRYRLRFSDKASEWGSPWYVPGYGRNDSHAIGGTFNLIFDI